MVWDVARALPGLPIIGIGGIADADDALEFLVAGASAVQVGTATFSDPTASERLLDDLTGAARRGRRRPASPTSSARSGRTGAGMRAHAPRPDPPGTPPRRPCREPARTGTRKKMQWTDLDLQFLYRIGRSWPRQDDRFYR